MPDRIGAIIENPGFLPEYSGFKNLKFLAMIHHKISNEEIRNAMRIVGLDPDSKKHVGKYSLGMLPAPWHCTGDNGRSRYSSFG